MLLDVTGDVAHSSGARGRSSSGRSPDRPGVRHGPAAAFLAALSSGTDRLDVIPTVQRRSGGWRRATPAEVGRLLGVAGPHHSVDDHLSALDPPSADTVVIGPTDDGRLVVSTVGGRSESVVVAVDPHAVEAALVPAGPADPTLRGEHDHSE